MSACNEVNNVSIECVFLDVSYEVNLHHISSILELSDRLIRLPLIFFRESL